MLALTTNEIDDLVHGRVTVYILAKLENLSCRQLGRYMENEDFKQWLKFDVGVKTGDRKGDALELIQSWVDEASRQVINLKPQAEREAAEKVQKVGDFVFHGDDLIAL